MLCWAWLWGLGGIERSGAMALSSTLLEVGLCSESSCLLWSEEMCCQRMDQKAIGRWCDAGETRGAEAVGMQKEGGC